MPILLVVLATAVFAVPGVKICGVSYDCGATDTICPSNYGANCASNCDVDCHTGGTENTPALCTDCMDNDDNGKINYINETGCNVCTQAACNAATGVNLAPYASCQDSQPTAPNAGTIYTNGSALRTGDGSILRLDCLGSSNPDSCWCASCKSPYTWNATKASCVVATEITEANGCTDSYDNDGAGGTDYNDAACSICTKAAMQALGYDTGKIVLGGAEAIYNSSPTETIYDETTKIRYAGGNGSSPTPKCYGVTCNAGYGYHVDSDLCVLCNPDMRGQSCAQNSGCGACGLICLSSLCAAKPAAVFGGDSYGHVNTPVSLTLTSTLVSKTTRYQIDTTNDGTYDFDDTTPLSRTTTYSAPGTYTASAKINWTAGTPALTETDVAPSRSIIIYTVPVVSDFKIIYTSNKYNASLLNVTLMLNGSCDAATTCSFDIDTDGDNIYDDAATGNSAPYSAQGIGLAAGTYTFRGRVCDDKGACTIQALPSFTVNTNTPPTITGWAPTTTSQWHNVSTNFIFTVADNTPEFNVVLHFGDGTADFTELVTSDSASYTINKVYLSAQSPPTFSAFANATDYYGVSASTVTTIITATSLPCVLGTQTGAATYNNRADQCCNVGVWPNSTGGIAPNSTTALTDRSCTSAAPSVETCFQRTACYPDQSTYCNSTVAFADRDTNATACETGGGPLSCTQYTWSDLQTNVAVQNYCCGDDGAGENPALWTYNGVAVNGPPLTVTSTNNACCTSPNQCYTTAGTPDCYGGVENTQLLCENGFDDDCDGFIDALDSNCAANKVNGTVRLYELSSVNWSSATAAQVYLTNAALHQTTAGYYEITSPSELLPGQKVIYATKPGYTVQQRTFTLETGKNYTIDFNLNVRRCDANCMNDQGYCDRTCVGVGDCQPTEDELKTLNACHLAGAPFGYRQGAQVALGDNGTDLLVGVCCTVPGLWRNAPSVTAEEAGMSPGTLGSIDTLVKFTRLVTLNGQTYKLIISTW